jgi:ABC-type sugar transport system substrate-binding protein
MSVEEQVRIHSLPAAGNYAAYQYCCVKSVAGVATLCATQGEDGIGILYNKPSALGKTAAIAMLNGSMVVKVKLGATVAADALVTPEVTTGRMGAVASGDYVWGRLKTGGDDGDIVEMYPNSLYVAAS